MNNSLCIYRVKRVALGMSRNRWEINGISFLLRQNHLPKADKLVTWSYISSIGGVNHPWSILTANGWKVWNRKEKEKITWCKSNCKIWCPIISVTLPLALLTTFICWSCTPFHTMQKLTQAFNYTDTWYIFHHSQPVLSKEEGLVIVKNHQAEERLSENILFSAQVKWTL